MSRGRLLLALAVLAVALVAVGSRLLTSQRHAGDGGPAPERGEPVNLLLVSLDTTGADRLGCYGDADAATPNMDRLAAEGLVADNAIAVAPMTLPSHASLLTGLYPPRHGVRDNADFRLPGAELTLAEHLGSQGYSTAAVIASIVLGSAQELAQGFEIYDEPDVPGSSRRAGQTVALRTLVERRAEEVTDRAIAALDGIDDEPFFLFVHYFDPHSEYDPPAPCRERFAGRPYDGEIA